MSNKAPCFCEICKTDCESKGKNMQKYIPPSMRTNLDVATKIWDSGMCSGESPRKILTFILKEMSINPDAVYVREKE